MSQKTRFWIWVAIIAGSLSIYKMANNIIRLYQAGGRVKKAELELQKLAVRKDEIEKQASESGTDRALERIAREKLGMGKPGEVVVIFEESDKNPKTGYEKPENNDENWRRWRRLYLGI